jgi:septum formation protein
MAPRLVLASASPFRKMLLENAGLQFDAEPAEIDERAVEDTIGGLDPDDVALVLAEAKAQDVSGRHPRRTGDRL